MSSRRDADRTTAVVICAYTAARWARLERAVEATLTQVPPPHKVLLVIDHNEDLAQRARSRFQNDGVAVLANAHGRGLAGARNTGLEATTADIVVFLDDDAAPRAGWLEALVAPFAQGDVAGVAGWVEPDWEHGRPAWWPTTFDWVVGCSYEGLPDAGGSVRNPIGASMAISRQLMGDAGGFAESLGRLGANLAGCEETELCIRIGAGHPELRFVHQPASIVDHFVPAVRSRPDYFLRRCWGEGRSKAAVGRLSGARQAIGPEARHASRTIPRRMLRDLVDLSAGPGGPGRAVAAAAGTGAAALAYLTAPKPAADSSRLAVSAGPIDTAIVHSQEGNYR